MPSRTLSLLVLLLVLAVSGPVSAQDLLYDDGGDHVLSSYSQIPGPDGALIEVRDGPGSDPTTLDVTFSGDLYELSFGAYGHSDLQLLGALGYVHVSAYDDATVSYLNALGYATSVSANVRSTVVAGSVGSAVARDDANLTLGGADILTGLGQANISMSTGAIYDGNLYESATMHMTGGTFGFDSGLVSDGAYLLVEGSASVQNAYGFRVDGSGRADIHSGALTAAGSNGIGVTDFGLLQLFGESWAIDGLPVGFGDIVVEPGQTSRSGRLTGMLESGDLVDIDFGVGASGILRLVPEPGSSAMLAAGLVLALLLSPRARAG